MAEEQNFDYQEFIRQMAEQAESLVPTDIAPDDKKYITHTVYNFCKLAFEAIVKEPNFTTENATMITQLIGEWTFHKSIDLIRANIVPQFRDVILQNIAFVTFEIAKIAISKQMNQTQIIQVVEHHVKQKYMESLTELRDKNQITQEDFDSAMGQSNIDKMAEAQEEQEIIEEEFSTSKILKLASFAMVLQKMPSEKAESILLKMPEREANLVRNYMEDTELSSKADDTIAKYISELKSNVPKSETINEGKLQNKLVKIVTKKNELKINDIILKERSGIKKYVSEIRENKDTQLPPRVSNIIYTYLAEKVSQ